MKNRIIIDDVIVQENRLSYQYHLEGAWECCFNQKENFYVEYSSDISAVPKSVAVIPLLGNLLPMAWVWDAEIVADEIDQAFYQSIGLFKQGYMAMYPMISFGGELTISRTVDNSCPAEQKSAAFFSGGADAFSTLIAHAEEKPALITVWGADIRLDDAAGWGRVKQHTTKTAGDFGLETLFIKSSFKSFLDEDNLNKQIAASQEGWWHGYQHGLGLIGLAAPYAFGQKLKTLYIASTFSITDQWRYTCASDPTIDNYVKFCSCQVVHDGYEFNRQDKIDLICQFALKHDQPIEMRVCWESSGGGNCCRCEKCYRTMMGIVAAKADPNDFGFRFDEKAKRIMIMDMKNKLFLNRNTMQFWQDVQKDFIRNRADIADSRDFAWFADVEMTAFNHTFWKNMRKIKQKVKQKIKGS